MSVLALTRAVHILQFYHIIYFCETFH